MRLSLPEEILVQKAVSDGSGSQETHGVPLAEDRLDPVLEEAVASQPPQEEPQEEKRGTPAQEEQGPPARGGKKRSPLGVLAVLGAGVMVLAGLALGTKGGASVPTRSDAGGAWGSAPRGPDLY